MLPLCADEGVQTIIHSPLARGCLARPWGESTAGSEVEAPYAKLYEATAESDQKIVEAVGKAAEERRVSRAQIAFTWLRRNPVSAVTAPEPTVAVNHIDLGGETMLPVADEGLRGVEHKVGRYEL